MISGGEPYVRSTPVRLFASIVLCMCPSAVSACDVYTSELWSPGERTAEYDGTQLTIVDRTPMAWDGHAMTLRYVESDGRADVRYRIARNPEDEKDVLRVRKYKNVLIIDMEVFEPYCPDASPALQTP